MIYLKIILYLPTTLLQWFSLLLTFDPKLYYPTSMIEQEISQHLRNKVRLTDYYIKRMIYKR